MAEHQVEWQNIESASFGHVSTAKQATFQVAPRCVGRIQLIVVRAIPAGNPRKKVRVPIAVGVHNFIARLGCDTDGEISIDIRNLLIILDVAQKFTLLLIKLPLIPFDYSKSEVVIGAAAQRDCRKTGFFWRVFPVRGLSERPVSRVEGV
jgi:hypothetical protein